MQTRWTNSAAAPHPDVMMGFRVPTRNWTNLPNSLSKLMAGTACRGAFADGPCEDTSTAAPTGDDFQTARDCDPTAYGRQGLFLRNGPWRYGIKNGAAGED